MPYNNLDAFSDDDGSAGLEVNTGSLQRLFWNGTQSLWEIVGGLAVTSVRKGTRNNVSSNISTAANDYYIGVDTSTGTYTITIRSTDIEDGRELVIHDQGGNASGNNITIATEGTETISGAQYGTDLSSITLNTDSESVTLRADANNNLYVV